MDKTYEIANQTRHQVGDVWIMVRGVKRLNGEKIGKQAVWPFIAVTKGVTGKIWVKHSKQPIGRVTRLEVRKGRRVWRGELGKTYEIANYPRLQVGDVERLGEWATGEGGGKNRVFGHLSACSS